MYSIAAGDKFTGSVERIDHDEAVAEAGDWLASLAHSSEMTGMLPGSSRARPCQIAASEASSAAVTGDRSGLIRCTTVAGETVRIAAQAWAIIAGQIIQQPDRVGWQNFGTRH